MSIRLDTCVGCGTEPGPYTSVIDGWLFVYKEDGLGNTWCAECVATLAPVLVNAPLVTFEETV